MTDLVYKAGLAAARLRLQKHAQWQWAAPAGLWSCLVSCDSGTFGGTWKLLDFLPHPLMLHIFIWQRVPGCFHCAFTCHAVLFCVHTWCREIPEITVWNPSSQNCDLWHRVMKQTSLTFVLLILGHFLYKSAMIWAGGLYLLHFVVKISWWLWCNLTSNTVPQWFKNTGCWWIKLLLQHTPVHRSPCSVCGCLSLYFHIVFIPIA